MFTLYSISRESLFEGLLHTVAQVAITMAGFSGVVFALGNRGKRKLSDKEKNGILDMLLASFGAVIISLIAIKLLSNNLDNAVAWRISCALAGVYVISGASRATLDMYRDKHS